MTRAPVLLRALSQCGEFMADDFMNVCFASTVETSVCFNWLPVCGNDLFARVHEYSGSLFILIDYARTFYTRSACKCLPWRRG